MALGGMLDSGMHMQLRGRAGGHYHPTLPGGPNEKNEANTKQNTKLNKEEEINFSKIS